MWNGFHIDAFMEYMDEQYVLDDFTKDMLRQIIGHGMEHHNAGKDQFCYYMTDVLPELEFGEIAAFCEYDILTDAGMLAKDEWIENHGKMY